jgi:anti-anti-sigma factor
MMDQGCVQSLHDEVEERVSDGIARVGGAPGLAARAGTRDGVPVLSLSGRLDAGGVGAVEALLTQALAGDQGMVPCDLTGLDYLSARAVRMLMEVAANRPRHPAPVVLCAASGQPARMLAAVDSDGRLPRYATVTEAVADPQERLRWAQLTLTCDLSAPRWARRFATTTCTTWGLPAVADEVALLASELVTNAVVHAGGAAQILLQRCGEDLTVAVLDGSDAAPTARSAQPWEESGRGLHLVEALSRADGTYPRPGGGKVVWCTIQLPTPN